jgi:hypothetical protein
MTKLSYGATNVAEITAAEKRICDKKWFQNLRSSLQARCRLTKKRSPADGGMSPYIETGNAF